MSRTLWIDASAGVAGDMLLGALVDLGVPLDELQAAVDAVLPRAARLTSTLVTRAGLRAVKVDVETDDDQPARHWSDVRRLLEESALEPAAADRALRTFGRLAAAEGRVHGVGAEEVHFHEVGAVDAIADVVGVCAGLVALGVHRVVLSPVALGAGSVRTAHGVLPVPTPAGLELIAGRDVLAAPPDAGELATPTGLALVTTAAEASGPLPAMTVLGTGVGAGTRDPAGRPNVVRLVLGIAPDASAREDAVPDERAVLLETNVDDLDPRVWPDVVARLLGAGALDAWLTPVLAKKGRPAQTLHVLARPQDELALAGVVLEHTSTLGVRRTPVGRYVLDRSWTPVQVLGGTVRVKVGARDGRILHATPEYEDAAALARERDLPVAHVLKLAEAAAVEAGLLPATSVAKVGSTPPG